MRKVFILAAAAMLAVTSGVMAGTPALNAGQETNASSTEQTTPKASRTPGDKITDFSMADTEGKTIKLSDYIGKGKYVLIDFWASWCPPCRAEIPHVKAAYEKYHDKGFEIVGVSLDNKKEAWTKAIQDYGMNWIHVSDLKGWKNEVAVMYGVRSIPATVLVGPDGIIIGVDYRGDQLEKKLAELLK